MSGFEYSKTDSGDSGNRVRTYNVPATVAKRIAVGDCVVLNGTSSATGVPQVVELSGTNPWTGVFTGVVVGVDPDYANESLSTNGLARSTAGNVKVVDDPFALFEVESDATLVIADVGLNVDIISTEATATGNSYASNYKIDGSSVAATAATPFQIVRLLPGATTGVLGDRAVVRINYSTLNAGPTGV